MKIRLELTHIACAALLYPVITIGAPNPASQDWVNAQIAAQIAKLQSETTTAAATLSAADWEAVCQNGNINSTNGCYGDAGSQAFAKINRLGGNPLGYAGVTGSAANSVWVRQVGAGTSCIDTDKTLYVLNTNTARSNTTTWICGAELTNGSSVSFAPGLGALVGLNQQPGPGTSASGIPFLTISISGVMAQGSQPVSPNILYFNDSTVLPTVYVFCVSTTSTTSTATAFAEAPAASFDSAIPC